MVSIHSVQWDDHMDMVTSHSCMSFFPSCKNAMEYEHMVQYVGWAESSFMGCP